MQGQSQQTEATGTEGESPLTISPEKVCFIIMKAREFDAKDEVTEPEPGSNPTDERVEHNSRHLCRRSTIKIMQASRPQARKFPLYQGRIKCFVRYVGRAERHRLGLDRSELSPKVSDRSIKRH